MKGQRRESRRRLVHGLLLWALLCVAIAAEGPDPMLDAAGFGLQSVPRMALAAVAVIAGGRRPELAVALLLPFGPWRFEHGLATSDLVWPLALPGVKIFPFAPALSFVMGYAYLCGRRPAPPRSAVAVFAVVTLAGAGLVVVRGSGPGLWITMVSGLLGAYVLPYAAGQVRRRLLQQRERAELSVAAQARLRERARIARDMHDSLGHDLALIAVRAAGLELSPGLDTAQVRAAGELRVAAADATERLRQIIGLLGDDAGPAPLTPVGEDVAGLVERARASGMAITLRLDGGPAPGLAHAVVQEGLTNAAKHAPGAAVTVEVSPSRVSVRNGPSRGRPVAVPGGLGLAGLRERARLAGGVLTAAPRQGGFELTVELP
ncbi:sensor histidine kinase [Nonomuraea roseoviolacea]|uniref:sensor histidine kinase n=1 Tax=Nonomuraea roseoviolacea TaxID=103837 RepID=UPI0031DEA7F7